MLRSIQVLSKSRYLLILPTFLFVFSCATTQAPLTPIVRNYAPIAHPQDVKVLSGLEVFLAQDHSGDSQKYGLLANSTCVDHSLIHGIDLLKEKIDLQLLLSPEHGLFGAEDAGASIGEERDVDSGIMSKTTYRKKPKDIAEMIADLDVVLFDIQDIGVRSYTYIYSMAYLMEAAAIAGKKVVVLDRPNPVNGVQMEGNLIDEGISSFVGLYPIPYRHAMTIGELALLFNAEYDINCDLEVVKMQGWTRGMWFEDTGLPWVPTSPHVPDASTILPMIATGTYGELQMLSEGVGTTVPFEYAGGPWITNPHEYARALQAKAGAGVTYRPTFFKPYYGRHKGQTCGGVQIHVTDPVKFQPYITGLLLMSVHQELYPDVNLFEKENRWSMFAKVTGSDSIREDIQAGKDPFSMQKGWQDDLSQFEQLRQPYLLYD